MKYLKLIPYLIIAFLLFRIINLNKENTLLLDKTAKLEENLKQKTIIYKDKIIFKERIKDTVSGTSVKQQTVYIPSEGSVSILTPEEGQNINLTTWQKIFNEVIRQEDGSIILIKNKGFTISPEISILYSRKLELGGQLKFLYWNRYNLGIGFTNEETLYGYLSRNISDVVPIFKNTSAQISYGKNLKENNNRLLFGLNVRL